MLTWLDRTRYVAVILVLAILIGALILIGIGCYYTWEAFAKLIGLGVKEAVGPWTISAKLAILKAVDAVGVAGVINIGSGVGSRLLDIAETVNEVFDNAGKLVVSGREAPGQLCRRLSIDLAAKKLGWSPSYSLCEGLLDFKRSAEKA